MTKIEEATEDKLKKVIGDLFDKYGDKFDAEHPDGFRDKKLADWWLSLRKK